ncbi:hypothetical protein F5148DRAFT_1181341 [Russula earlei]|uniref:Uncharacterized protein n=1 Tax=Russula earlei TaxID=71964 RepID=A0ACC0UEX3_9AGAM|nr:hypothetical protein F5148DRAFT_1181341 [Russula earlei]
MENTPPFPVVRLARPSSLMHSLPSKSSPTKRDTTRVLTPHPPAPFQDVFNTGLLTPQASQFAVDSDAAKSLISPPPEDPARTGTSRQSVRYSPIPPPVFGPPHSPTDLDASPRGHELVRSPPHLRVTSRTPAVVHPSANAPRSHRTPYTTSTGQIGPSGRRCVSEEEGDAGNDGHPFANASAVARKPRQSNAPPPESIKPDRLARSPTKLGRSPTLLRSPHAENDKADYIPPHLSARARSSTPLPAYEPPAERFTPPREVFLSSPRVSKSSKRKKTLKVTIKKEPPEIDLSRLPPPSPTDDPILLHGRPRRPRPPVPTNARETPLLESTPPGPGRQSSPINRCALDFPLPGIPSDVDDHEDPDLPEQPVFNFAADGEDFSSSSDGDGLEHEGEYTGRFRVVHVPTKADPPTSTTRERIEQWGRPISPFPHGADPILEDEMDNGADGSSDTDLSPARPQFRVEEIEDRRVPEALEDVQGSEIEVQEEHAKATETSEMGLITPPSVLLANDNHVRVTSHIEAAPSVQDGSDEALDNFGEIPTYPQQDMRENCEPGDENSNQNGNTPSQERDETVANFHPVLDSGDGELVGEERTDEEIVDRALSEEPGPFTSPRQRTAEPQLLEESVEVDEPMVEAADAESEGDSGDESDFGVIKVVSDDPWAAARAAAILKQHDWDLVMKARKNRSVESLIRKARRGNLTSAGVSKSSRSPRRSFGVVVDGRVVMAGSPSMTLPELLHEVESELDSPTFLSRPQSAFRTPSPAPSYFRRPEAPLVIDTDGPREWSRSDWKLLDACFTDARLQVGARWGSEGVLGDVDAVELEDVVRRFEDIFGGEEFVAGLGPAFEWEDLLKRAKALQKKQRDGRGAPATPTLRFSSVSSTPTVPDFTPVHPARRHGVGATQPRLAAPAFETQPAPRLPASLMAPRYSHLLEEAKSLSVHDNPGSSTPGELAALPSPAADNNGVVTGATSHTIPDESVQEVPSTPSVGSRMKGFIFSYLPTLKKKTPAQKKHEPVRPGLPLPPPELLEKPRGPVITPQPRPAPRPAHPKELVHLQQAPQPSRIPMIPRVPKRMVDLRPVSPPPAASGAIKIPESRRTSGGSVKDLVSSFEDMERSREIDARALELRRQRSAGRLAAGATTGVMRTRKDGRPEWR